MRKKKKEQVGVNIYAIYNTKFLTLYISAALSLSRRPHYIFIRMMIDIQIYNRLQIYNRI